MYLCLEHFSSVFVNLFHKDGTKQKFCQLEQLALFAKSHWCIVLILSIRCKGRRGKINTLYSLKQQACFLIVVSIMCSELKIVWFLWRRHWSGLRTWLSGGKRERELWDWGKVSNSAPAKSWKFLSYERILKEAIQQKSKQNDIWKISNCTNFPSLARAHHLPTKKRRSQHCM